MPKVLTVWLHPKDAEQAAREGRLDRYHGSPNGEPAYTDTKRRWVIAPGAKYDASDALKKRRVKVEIEIEDEDFDFIADPANQYDEDEGTGARDAPVWVKSGQEPGALGLTEAALERINRGKPKIRVVK